MKLIKLTVFPTENVPIYINVDTITSMLGFGEHEISHRPQDEGLRPHTIIQTTGGMERVMEDIPTILAKI